jgi:site-specific recombinase XerD
VEPADLYATVKYSISPLTFQVTRAGASRFSAHLLRHTWATRFVGNGGDLLTLQEPVAVVFRLVR